MQTDREGNKRGRELFCASPSLFVTIVVGIKWKLFYEVVLSFYKKNACVSICNAVMWSDEMNSGHREEGCAV